MYNWIFTGCSPELAMDTKILITPRCFLLKNVAKEDLKQFINQALYENGISLHFKSQNLTDRAYLVDCLAYLQADLPIFLKDSFENHFK